MVNHDEKGSIFIETSIFIPLLIVILMGILQIASYLRSAQLITRAAYEGARLAAKTSGLEVKLGTSLGVTCTDVESVSYDSYGNPTNITVSSANACADEASSFPEIVRGHQSVQSRVNFAMSLQSLSTTGSPLWSSQVIYDQALNRVTVKVSANVRSLLGIGDLSIPVRATQSLPYLAN